MKSLVVAPDRCKDLVHKSRYREATIGEVNGQGIQSTRGKRVCELLFVLGGLWVGLLAFAPSLVGLTTVVPADLLLQNLPWVESSERVDVESFPSNIHAADQAFQGVPYALIVRQSLSFGELPFWNPYFRHGMPLLGNGQSAPFSPLLLPLRFFPLPHGFAWSLVLKIAVLWAGTWLYGRRIGLRGFCCLGLCVGVLFAPQMITWGHHPNFNALVFFPWLLLFVERIACHEDGPADLLASSLGLSVAQAFQLLGGHFQSSFILTVGIVLYGGVRMILENPRTSPKKLLLAGLALLTGTVVAAPAILPFIDVLAGSETLVSREHLGTGQHTIPSDALVLLFKPLDFGSYTGYSERVWTETVHFWNHYQLYVGMLPLFLSPLVLLCLFRPGDYRSVRVAVSWLLPLIVGLELVLGISPFHGKLTALPLFDVHRNARFALFPQIAVVVFAMLALNELVKERKAGAERPGLVLAVTAVLLAIVGFAMGRMGYWDWRPAVTVPAAILAVGAAVAAPIGSRGISRELPWLVPILMLVDVLPVWWNYYPQPPREWYDRATTLPDELQNHLHPEHGVERLITAGTTPCNVSALYEIEDIRGYDFPVSIRHARYRSEVMGVEDDDEIPRECLFEPDCVNALMNSGASWMLASRDLLEIEPWASTETVAALTWDLRLQRIPGAAIATWHKEQSALFAEDTGSAARLARDQLPLSNRCIVIEDANEEYGPESEAVAAPAVPCRIVSRTNNTIVIRAPDSYGPSGWMLVRYSWDAGWTARDQGGTELQIYPAQVKYMAVRLTDESKLVTLKYEPPSFRRGLALSLGGIGFWTAGLGALAALRRRRL